MFLLPVFSSHANNQAVWIFFCPDATAGWQGGVKTLHWGCWQLDHHEIWQSSYLKSRLLVTFYKHYHIKSPFTISGGVWNDKAKVYQSEYIRALMLHHSINLRPSWRMQGVTLFLQSVSQSHPLVWDEIICHSWGLNDLLKISSQYINFYLPCRVINISTNDQLHYMDD